MDKKIENYIDGYAKCIEELNDRINNSIKTQKKLQSLEDFVNVFNDIMDFIYNALTEIKKTKKTLKNEPETIFHKLYLIKGGKKE
ncbi:MAG: hypothetical protein PHE29_01680 [Tissierellia bacterium]|nr:hypothetical protein [Tissierellia bacterium]